MNRLTIAAAVTLLTAPLLMPKAHAISAGYRAQLEKSGCTQLTDGNGCDIHKTKAQNSKAKANPVAFTHWAQGLTDVEICQQSGIAQARHDKARYHVLGDEIEQRERSKVWTLDQGSCTALAVAEMNKRNGEQ